MTLAVEMPPDSYGRLEATATLIVDAFVAARRHAPVLAPAELRRGDHSEWENCSAYAQCVIRRDRRGLRVAGRRESPRASSCASRAVLFLRSPSTAAPFTIFFKCAHCSSGPRC